MTWNCLLCDLLLCHAAKTYRFTPVIVNSGPLRKEEDVSFNPGCTYSTQHTPTLTSFNGTSCVNKVFSVEQYLLF